MRVKILSRSDRGHPLKGVKKMQNLVQKVNAEKTDLINTVRCVGLNLDVNNSAGSRHVLHERPPSACLG
jgi:outer membrane receptor for Fe3+-dicitrate